MVGKIHFIRVDVPLLGEERKELAAEINAGLAFYGRPDDRALLLFHASWQGAVDVDNTEMLDGDDDDIVSRLLEHRAEEKKLGNDLLASDLFEAAKRIKIMRVEIKRWQTIAHCRSCEPLDDYYCTNHREEEADEVDRA